MCSRYGLNGFADALKAILEDGHSGSMAPTQNRTIGLVERFEALSQLLAALSQARTMIIVMDDVQWGDVALGWLEVLASRWSHLPVLVVCTLRADLVQARHPALFALNRWVEMGLAETVQINPLPEVELTRIVSQRLQIDEGTLAAAVEKTQGNPLFLEAMVNRGFRRHPRARPGWFSSSGSAQLVLPNHYRIWFDRLTSYIELDGPLWQSLELAAILGSKLI